MPSKTFFNLSEEKKNKIIEAALKEFSLNDYNSASTNNIVKDAGISKGSMYQYFDNKKDLYLYLLEIASNKKLNYISKKINLENDKIFDLIKKMHLAGAKFDLTNPKYSMLIINAINETTNEKLGNISSSLKEKSDQFFNKYIQEGQKKNLICDDLDPELLSFLISRLSMVLIEYVSKKYNFTYLDLIKKGEHKLPLPENELEKILEQFIA
ncbi:MAG: TetR/AcrR family transcriptional regulator, partial [Bacillota bacterium]